MKSFSRRVFLGVGAAAASAVYFGRRMLGIGSPETTETTEMASKSACDIEVTDKTIVSARIHPGIGVARVGSSDEHYVGPEVMEPLPPEAKREPTHDSKGKLKRQAARFRLYGYNKAGQVVQEILPGSGGAEVEWAVHVANKKPDWYRFLAALDISDSKDMHCKRRNPDITDRQSLIIDSGITTIHGKNQHVELTRGKFKSTPVALGDLRTDEDGHLLVVGGRGKAGSPSHAPVFKGGNEIPESERDPDSFNNADDWWDDICDGPVRATLKLNGQNIPVDSAWVITAPPNYSPETIGWRTMDDLMLDLFTYTKGHWVASTEKGGRKIAAPELYSGGNSFAYVEGGWYREPKYTSFTKDILPLLRRLVRLGWVNQGFADRFKFGTDFDFDNPETLAKLGKDQRQIVTDEIQKVYAQFRMPKDADAAKDVHRWPMLYGDAYNADFTGRPDEVFVVPQLQALHLERWVKGELTPMRDDSDLLQTDFSKVCLQNQPAMLDRAAMHYCLADAFHPGCELTWPMRWMSMYRAPYRIRERAEGQAEADLGAELTQKSVFQIGGPLFAQGPGDLTRWMALPWHGDTINCRSGYDDKIDPFVPSFWPARVPNQVMALEDYAVVMDTSRTPTDRTAAFQRRAFWWRGMRGSVRQQMDQMVKEFDKSVGVLRLMPGPKNDPNGPKFPEWMYVEYLPSEGPEEAVSFGAGAGAGGAPGARGVPIPAGKAPKPGAARPDAPQASYQKAGWESPEQRDEFRRARFHR